MKRVALALLAAVALAACGNQRGQPLPKPAHWFGSKIWVPTGYARSMAPSICFSGEVGGWWEAIAYPAGGEVLICNEVQEQYEG
jgi:hypothetical protein